MAICFHQFRRRFANMYFKRLSLRNLWSSSISRLQRIINGKNHTENFLFLLFQIMCLLCDASSAQKNCWLSLYKCFLQTKVRNNFYNEQLFLASQDLIISTSVLVWNVNKRRLEDIDKTLLSALLRGLWYRAWNTGSATPPH